MCSVTTAHLFNPCERELVVLELCWVCPHCFHFLQLALPKGPEELVWLLTLVGLPMSLPVSGELLQRH